MEIPTKLLVYAFMVAGGTRGSSPGRGSEGVEREGMKWDSQGARWWEPGITVSNFASLHYI